MPCNTSLLSIIRACETSLGGVTAIYLAPSEFISATTVTAGTITNITMSGSAKFVTYEFAKNSASFTEEAAISLENGSTVFTQTLTLNLIKRDATKRQSLALLLAGQRSVNAIIKTSNGNYFYLGLTAGGNATALTGGSGAAKGDLNGYTLTILAEEPEAMPEVSSAIIAAIIS